jgi:hypothetical protein
MKLFFVLFFMTICLQPLVYCANNPPFAQLVVTNVPAYLYANATYWVPVTFHISGLGDHVKVSDGSLIVKLYVDGKVIPPFPIFNPPFAYDNGKNAQENGLHNTYTLWIDSAQMNTIQNGQPVSNNAWFQVMGSFKNNDDESSDPIPLNSSQQQGSIVNAFSDNHVAVAEIGRVNKFFITDPQQRYFETSHVGSFNLVETAQPDGTLSTPLPVPIIDLDKYFFEGSYVSAGIINNRVSTLGIINTLTSLTSLAHVGANSDYTFRMQVSGVSLGVYWGNSYGPMKPEVIAPDLGMDLTQSTAGASLDSFPESQEIFSAQNPNISAEEFEETELKVFSLLVESLVPEEWVLVKAAPMLTEVYQLIEDTNGLDGKEDRATNIVYRYHFIVTDPHGNGARSVSSLREDSIMPTQTIPQTQRSGEATSAMLTITAGSTDYYFVEIDNGIEVYNNNVHFTDYTTQAEGDYNVFMSPIIVTSH